LPIGGDTSASPSFPKKTRVRNQSLNYPKPSGQ
jgi:hypothetical protein